MSGLLSLYPNAGSYSASTNADKVRANVQWLEEALIFTGTHPDFDGAFTYTSGTLTQALYTEQTASATADGRGSGTRKIAKQTLTYTAGVLTKVKNEISYNNGVSYAIWVGRAGNAYMNPGYTSGDLTSTTMATS